MSDNDDWLMRLQALLLRFPELGAAADAAGMSKPEQWGLYCHLMQRLLAEA